MDAALGVLILAFAGVGMIVIFRGLRRRRGMLGALRRRLSEQLVRRAHDQVGQDARPLAARYERLSEAEKDPAFHRAVSRLTKQSLGIAHAMAAAQDDEPMVAAIGLSALANRALGPVPSSSRSGRSPLWRHARRNSSRSCTAFWPGRRSVR
jgi:hypothetical protein